MLIIGFNLNGCIHKKQLKMRNLLAFYYLLYLVHTLILLFCHILYIFLNVELLVKMLNFMFIIIWKLGYLDVIKFCTAKMKKNNTFHGSMQNDYIICFRMWFSHKIWVMGRGVPQGHKSKVSRPSAMEGSHKI